MSRQSPDHPRMGYYTFDDIPLPPPTYAEHLAVNGGIATFGAGLGMVVGRDESVVPPGWIFIPLEAATPQIVQECLDHGQKQRTTWPDKEAHGKPIGRPA